MSQKMKFVRDWIANLMKQMESHVEDEIKIGLLEECGRSCAKTHARKEALKFKGNLDGWIGRMGKWVGEQNVRKEAEGVQVTYSRCLCPLVQNGPPILSRSYCNCSRGWLLETFETVMDKPVQVRLEASIMRGDRHCRFTVFT